MSYLVPTWYVDHEQKTEFRRNTRKALAIRAFQLGFRGKGYSGAIDNLLMNIRFDGLLPQHLGIASWELPPCPKGEVVPWFDVIIPEDICIALYMVTQLTIRPRVDQLIFQHSSSNYILELTQLLVYGHEGFISEPHILSPGMTFEVSIGSQRGTKKGHRLFLGGLVVNREGDGE